MQINDDYVEKAHWSNFINSTFNLSSEHQFKEFIVYSEKLTKEEMMNNACRRFGLENKWVIAFVLLAKAVFTPIDLWKCFTTAK